MFPVRTELIAGNWKMNKTIQETRDFMREFIPLVKTAENREILLCVPFTVLHAVAESLAENPTKLGAQDVFWEEKGAYTGEISALMLKDSGCSYVIIGHSERRHILGEKDLDINRKIKAALEASLTPLCCVGETLQDRENNLARDVVKKQLEEAFKGIDLSKGIAVIAYEPVWAIGTGVNASTDDAQEMIAFIREQIGQKHGQPTAERIRILYGGSVNANNIAALMSQKDIDGVLVGGASLKAQEFAQIVRMGHHG